MGSGDVAEAAAELLLQVQPWKCLDDCGDFGGRNDVVLQAEHVETDAGGAQRHLALLVEADRGRRIQRHAVPDQLRAALIEAARDGETARQIRAFDLEAARTFEPVVEGDVVQQRADGEDLGVVVGALNLPEPCGEQPGPNDVVEEIGLAMLPCVRDRGIDHRCVGHRYSGEHPCVCRFHRRPFAHGRPAPDGEDPALDASAQLIRNFSSSALTWS
jgi:hypothetical protein